MASSVIVTLKVLPANPDTDLAALRTAVDEEIKKFLKSDKGADKVEEEPVAYGIKALKFIFLMDEERGSTEDLEKAITEVPGVNSVEVTDVRRAIG